jgi:centromeric protein E
MLDVFGLIKRTPDRDYLLQSSYLAYNKTAVDLLALPMMAEASPVQIQGGAGEESHSFFRLHVESRERGSSNSSDDDDDDEPVSTPSMNGRHILLV